MVHVKVSESQLKKNTVMLVKIYSLLIRVCKSPPLRSQYYTKYMYYCLDRVIFALYLYAEVTAFLYEGCAILRTFVALYNENFR